MNGENGSCRRDPVHARHRDVHDDQVGTQVARKLKGNVAVGRLLDNIRDLCEQSDDKRAKRIVVVHDQCPHETPLPPRILALGLDYAQISCALTRPAKECAAKDCAAKGCDLGCLPSAARSLIGREASTRRRELRHARHRAGKALATDRVRLSLDAAYQPIQRRGFSIVASPWYADVLLVTGTVTTRMREPPLAAYRQTHAAASTSLRTQGAATPPAASHAPPRKEPVRPVRG
jgi:hypothetical protein